MTISEAMRFLAKHGGGVCEIGFDPVCEEFWIRVGVKQNGIIKSYRTISKSQVDLAKFDLLDHQGKRCFQDVEAALDANKEGSDK